MINQQFDCNIFSRFCKLNRSLRRVKFFLTGLKISLDGIGVLQIPNGLCGVQHDYEKWSESAWEDKINLTQDAKAKISRVHKISLNY